MEEIIEEVERFIHRLYDTELLVSEEAHKLKLQSQRVFSDRLATALTTFIIGRKADDQKARLQQATECLDLINRAYAHGLIKPGQELLAKLETCRKEKTELVRDLAICMANYDALKKEYGKLVAMVDHIPGEEENKPSDQP